MREFLPDPTWFNISPAICLNHYRIVENLQTVKRSSREPGSWQLSATAPPVSYLEVSLTVTRTRVSQQLPDVTFSRSERTDLILLLQIEGIDLLDLALLYQRSMRRDSACDSLIRRTSRKKKTSLFARSAAWGSREFCEASVAPWAGMVGVALRCLMSYG